MLHQTAFLKATQTFFFKTTYLKRLINGVKIRRPLMTGINNDNVY